MSFEVTIVNGIRCIEIHGPITNSSLSEDFREYWQSKSYDNNLNELYDFSQSTLTDRLDGEGLQALAELNLEINGDAPRVKIAIIAQDSLTRGVSRQTMAYMGRRFDSERIKLFENKEDAIAWLTT